MDIGKLSEEKICNYCTKCFFPEFVYSSPPAPGQYKKKRELIDALIWFDGTLVIIESKAKASTKDNVSWINKSLSKANRQLKGAIRKIKISDEFLLENSFGVLDKISFEKSVHDIIPVIVLNIDDPPMNLWKLQFDNRPSDLNTIVFTLKEFLDGLCEFDTAPDFIQFLKTVQILTSSPFDGNYRSGFFIDLFREYGIDFKEIPDNYLDDKCEHVQFVFPSLSVVEVIKRYQEKKLKYHSSYLIDDIIDECRRHFDEKVTTYIHDFVSPEITHYTYREIVYILSSFKREFRNVIGNKLIECYQKLFTKKKPSIFSIIHPDRKFGVSFRVDRKTNRNRQLILLEKVVMNQRAYDVENYLGVEVLHFKKKIKFNYILRTKKDN